MRRLLYAPLIHSEPDLGSAGPALARGAIELWGQERWAAHQEVVAQLWRRLEECLATLNPRGLVIYQDGLPAAGEAAMKIVRAGAQRGSENYACILKLVERGAEIRKTEDEALLGQELGALAELARALGRLGDLAIGDADRVGSGDPAAGWRRYQRRQGLLTRERDRFIANTINETLREGETALLFLGAYHDVLPQLAPDIAVEALKDPRKVRAYYRDLARSQSPARWRRLARYLAAPVALGSPAGPAGGGNFSTPAGTA